MIDWIDWERCICILRKRGAWFDDTRLHEKMMTLQSMSMIGAFYTTDWSKISSSFVFRFPLSWREAEGNGINGLYNEKN